MKILLDTDIGSDIDDEICQMVKGNVEIELVSKQLLGYTHWQPDAFSGKHNIAISVDKERFFREFFSVFKR